MRKIFSKVVNIFQELLPQIIVILWGISLVLFFLWYLFIWPLGNIGRNNVILPLQNGGELNITYPKFIRIGDAQVSSIDLKLDRTYSTKVKIVIPSELSLIGIEPPSTLISSSTKKGTTNVVLAWDEIAFEQHMNLLSPSRSLDDDVSMVPRSVWIEWDDELSAILANNIRLELINNRLANHSGFNVLKYETVRLKIYQFPHLNHVDIPLKVETVRHSQWRLFAEKYSIVAIGPFFVSVLSLLGKLYTDRLQRKKTEAQENQNRFLEIIKRGKKIKELSELYDELDKNKKYLNDVDWHRIHLIKDAMDGNVSNLSHNMFSDWSDVWAGAFFIAVTDAEKLQKLEKNQAFRRHLRMFPREKLSPLGDVSLQNVIKKIKLGDLEARSSWPFMPLERDEFQNVKNRFSLNFFPSVRADERIEQYYLFADRYFWREHDQYSIISKKLRTEAYPQVVWGKSGIGKTALALALSRFYIDDPYTFGCYRANGGNIRNVQVTLAQALLDLVRQRTTWLIRLEQDDRSLLARLWVSVLDRYYILAQLNQLDEYKISEPPKGSESFWQEQSAVELRLLKQAVEQSDEDIVMQPDAWLYGLSYIVDALDFSTVIVAIDLNGDQHDTWLDKEFLELSLWIQQSTSVPVRLLATINTEIRSRFRKKSNCVIQELSWSADSLREMFMWRAMRNGASEKLIVDNLSTLNILFDEANGNPRKLANIWYTFRERYPDVDSLLDIKPEMLNECICNGSENV